MVDSLLLRFQDCPCCLQKEQMRAAGKHAKGDGQTDLHSDSDGEDHHDADCCGHTGRKSVESRVSPHQQSQPQSNNQSEPINSRPTPSPSAQQPQSISPAAVQQIPKAEIPSPSQLLSSHPASIGHQYLSQPYPTPFSYGQDAYATSFTHPFSINSLIEPSKAAMDYAKMYEGYGPMATNNYPQMQMTADSTAYYQTLYSSGNPATNL